MQSTFPIRKVIVQGVYWNTPQEEIEKIVAPYAKRGYFLSNLFFLQAELKKACPWIKEVSISRQWPDELLINLNQKEAVAIFNHQSLVTEEGEVFTPSLNTFPPDLPSLLGSKEEVKLLLNQYHVFTSLLNSDNLSIIQLQLSSDGNWSVDLSNKIVLMLGDKDILARFQRFVKVYQQVFVPQHREPNYVDMRYSHGMAVNWKS